MSNLNSELVNQIQTLGIPVVETHNPVTNPKEFMDYVRELQNFEGFVIAWEDGHRVKIKAAEYLRIHKTKDAITQEKNVVDLLINEKMDDTKAFMQAEDRHRVEKFESEFWQGVSNSVERYERYFQLVLKSGLDRKSFALNWLPTIKENDPFAPTYVFARFNGKDPRELIINEIKKNTGTQTKIDNVRHLWGHVTWKYSVVD